jgi:competence protein ComEC
MLIDGGGNANRPYSDRMGLSVVEPALRREGINRIDVLMVSHPHDDHVEGLTPVVRDFPVGMILDPQIPYPAEPYQRFLSAVAAKRIPSMHAVRGQVIDFHDGTVATLLGPPPKHLLGTGDDVNNNSIIVRITYAGRALMMTGDAGMPAEEQALSFGTDFRSDVLKVGHHGSALASGNRWLDAVHPSIAVISVGKDNSFGHPSRPSLDRLGSHGIRVLRTDLLGTIEIRMDSAGVHCGPLSAAR